MRELAAAVGLASFTALGFVSTVFAGGSSKLPPVSTRTNVTYANDIRPIFAANCFTCHGENRQQRHLRLDSLEALKKGCEDGPVIFPGKSDQGDLILEICGLGDHDMPPYPSPPPFLAVNTIPTFPPPLAWMAGRLPNP